MSAPDPERRFPSHGWRGLAAIVCGLGLSFLDAAWAPSAASILVWWGLVFALDAAAHAHRGASVAVDAPDALVWMAVLSIFLGVSVEWAAGRLGAWAYLGLPSDELLRYGVQGAVFAAYLPALHGGAEILGAGTPAVEPMDAWPKIVGLVLGAAALTWMLAFETPLQGILAMAFAFFALALFTDAATALRGHASFAQQGFAEPLRWSIVGIVLAGGDTFLTTLTRQGRLPIAPEGPTGLGSILFLAVGPAFRSSYLLLASILGRPAWRAKEKSSGFVTISGSRMGSAVVMPDLEEEVTEGKETLDEEGKFYHVILLNDEDHTYDYVIEMLMEIFGFGEDKAYQHTVEVDTKGHTRLATLPLSEAEKKRDAIHAYGADWRLERSLGAMAALIEPAE